MNDLNEITINNAISLEKFRAQGRICKTSVYAYTFEKVYLVYYYKRAAGKENFQYDYLAIDTNTGLSSHVSTRKSVLLEGEFKSLIPDINRSIKYAVDKRNALAPRSLR